MNEDGGLQNPELLKLLAYSIPHLQTMDIVPASFDRSSMAATAVAGLGGQFSEASQAGWAILNPEDIEVNWNGGSKPSDLRITSSVPGMLPSAGSYSGYGILTWRLPFFFRVPAPFKLRIRGPINSPKDGAVPLEALLTLSADGAMASMNWKITRIGTPIRFRKSEPICVLCPEEQGLVERFVPEIRNLAEDAGLEQQYLTWRRQKNVLLPPTGRSSPEGIGKADARNSEKRVAEFKDLRPAQKTPAKPNAQQVEHRPVALTTDAPKTEPWSNRKDPSTEPFRVEENFYEQASTLQEQIANYIQKSSASNGASILSYAYLEGVLQHVALSADQVFAREVLLNFMDRLRAWSRETLGLSHASTPKVSVYTNGCWRALVRDNVPAKWHYVLSLTRNAKHSKAKIQVLVDSTINGTAARRFSAGRVLTTKLDFNQLIAHEISKPYGVEPGKVSGNVLNGATLLDGYLW